MKKKLLFIFINLVAILITLSSYAQIVLSGRVIDKKNQAVPFTNIGIKGGKLGAVSKDDGRFIISIPDSLSNDSLTFSSVGFRDRSYIINFFKNNKTDFEVVLDEKIVSLNEIRVSNNKLKQYKLGITGRTPMLSIPSKSYQKNDILEQARLIKLDKPVKIINANIFVISESAQEVNIRLNFYSLENGLPGKRVVEKSIIRKALIKKGWYSIDLDEENIYLNENFVVSFEYLPGEQSSIVFAAKIGASDSFLRSSSLGKWRKNQVGGCSIYVTAER